MAPSLLSPVEAAATLRPQDTLGIPLGPGQPSAFLHALGDRTDWTDLTVFGALLVDLYAVFMHPGVRYLSGFFGPAERFLVDVTRRDVHAYFGALEQYGLYGYDYHRREGRRRKPAGDSGDVCLQHA